VEDARPSSTAPRHASKLIGVHTKNIVLRLLLKLKHPYPSYDEMYAKLPFMLLAEYGEPNHEWCKKIYENITNVILVRSMGENINKRGGFQAMQANFTTLQQFSPTTESNNMRVARYWRCVESVWDGIGEWRE